MAFVTIFDTSSFPIASDVTAFFGGRGHISACVLAHSVVRSDILDITDVSRKGGDCDAAAGYRYCSYFETAHIADFPCLSSRSVGESSPSCWRDRPPIPGQGRGPTPKGPSAGVRQGRLNQWATGFFFFLEGPQLAMVK